MLMNEFFATVSGWLNDLFGYNLSIHGYIAIVLALVGVFGLYIGLMILIRKSHTSGHDDAVQDYRDPRT